MEKCHINKSAMKEESLKMLAEDRQWQCWINVRWNCLQMKHLYYGL